LTINQNYFYLSHPPISHTYLIIPFFIFQADTYYYLKITCSLTGLFALPRI
jgi:hypothetical protein